MVIQCGVNEMKSLQITCMLAVFSYSRLEPLTDRASAGSRVGAPLLTFVWEIRGGGSGDGLGAGAAGKKQANAGKWKAKKTTGMDRWRQGKGLDISQDCVSFVRLDSEILSWKLMLKVLLLVSGWTLSAMPSAR